MISKATTASSSTAALMNLVRPTWLWLKRACRRFDWFCINISYVTSTTWMKLECLYRTEVSLAWHAQLRTIHFLSLIFDNSTGGQYIDHEADWRTQTEQGASHDYCVLQWWCVGQATTFFIDKYENTRCFKNINQDSFGRKYRSNKKA